MSNLYCCIFGYNVSTSFRVHAAPKSWLKYTILVPSHVHVTDFPYETITRVKIRISHRLLESLESFELIKKG